MIFDPPPADLPVATLVPRGSRPRIAADLRAWFVAKWTWFRPRTIPLAAAVLGMLAVLGSVQYLQDYAHRAPERMVASPQGDASANHVVIVIGR